MQYTIWGEEMPESIGVFSSQSSSMHDVQTLSAGQMLQKEAKGWRMQEASTPLLLSQPSSIFFQEFPSKNEKKALLCRICGGEFCG